LLDNGKHESGDPGVQFDEKYQKSKIARHCPFKALNVDNFIPRLQLSGKTYTKNSVAIRNYEIMFFRVY
jgi:hypothetical protein